MKSYKEYIEEITLMLSSCKKDIRSLVIDNYTDIYDGARGKEYLFMLERSLPCLITPFIYSDEVNIISNVRMVVVSNDKTQIVIDTELDGEDDTLDMFSEEYKEKLENDGELYDIDCLLDRNIIDLYGEIEMQLKI